MVHCVYYCSIVVSHFGDKVYQAYLKQLEV